MQTAATAANVQVELRRVAEVLILQLNIVPAARGRSTVSSFFASYLCDACDEEYSMLLEIAVHGEQLARMTAPPMSCPRCRAAMELCNPPELSFTFFNGGSALR